MTTQFTIEIDEMVLLKAEEYAKEKGLSLSELIENYLKGLTKDEELAISVSSITDAFRGSTQAADGLNMNSMVSEDLSPRYVTMKTIQIKIPNDVDVQGIDFSMAVAAQLYNIGKISLGQGAEMVGLSKMEFMELLSKYGVAVINHDSDDLTRDMQNAYGNRI